MGLVGDCGQNLEYFDDIFCEGFQKFFEFFVILVLMYIEDFF